MTGAFIDASGLQADQRWDCDVCIVGSGAGGAVLAAGLAQAGLDVIVLEEGGRYLKEALTLQEADAMPAMYQERGTRTTDDLAITILQGRAVGGSTMVNWTTCYRLPERIKQHWATHHGLELGDLSDHEQAVEARLSIATWPTELANANNRVLREGCTALGWEVTPLRRNVKGCADSGYCGLGCPVDGKQAMGITYLADAVAAGARVVSRASVRRLQRQGRQVSGVQAQAWSAFGQAPDGVAIDVQARVVVCSGGAINTPALLLRSGLDGGGLVGRRTFIHPVIGVVGRYADPIRAFYGAPQSQGSHQFVDVGPDKVGFFMETAPLQPMLAALAGCRTGQELHAFMADLPYIGSLLALSVDGLVPGDEGGVVSLKSDGSPSLAYPIKPWLNDSFARSHRALAQVHLAAGALEVYSLHLREVIVRKSADLQAFDRADYGAHQHAIFTAHQMGGCPMGSDPKRHPTTPEHRFRGVDNLFIVDGSVLPTALGVNPSETIYTLAHRAVDFVKAGL